MRTVLIAKRSLAGDILELCEKAPPPRFIRVPGARDDAFHGYETANELLESLHVNTKKVSGARGRQFTVLPNRTTSAIFGKI